MPTRMLIDARHPEETRVVVVKGNRIEEFDFEAAARKQIKGNIYLAKVTRVEPSLQAAFIDYGGNRHGFLAFSEIHPDYYQIPKEDREALLREERRLAEEHGAAEDAEAAEAADERPTGDEPLADAGDPGDGDDEPRPAPEEHGGSDDAGAEALRKRRMALRRRYKIQEVIRRRQVMLVQVVKEERGNKGAALTTYISLAGRYSVLMPNTAQGGGISRKIANAADRKRLKAIVAELALPATMGAIVRTAGLERTKAEIKRDFDYLARLWDEIREKTLSSTAPALIHEDSDLVKRAIRDVYSREIDEVLVDGADGYAQAKSFMKLLMPSHARRVQPYAEPVPLFQQAGVENQLAQLLNPVVTLKSGGYLVINSTEALVAIDVNSGRSTREHNIEETALKTNLEAADEVARQLRLRDLAGLVVVDFIDMESHGNNRKVERALKEALKRDRARIQVGRISSFGLLEMSRQRLRTGVLEASTAVCPMCEGTGLVRTPGSAALAALRTLEEEIARRRASQFRLRADADVAVYILNRKRAELAELEARYGVAIEVAPDDALLGGHVAIDASGPAPLPGEGTARPGVLAAPVADDDEPVEEEEEDEPDDEPVRRRERNDERGNERSDERAAGERGGERSGRRRRRGGRNRRGRDGNRRSEGSEAATNGATASDYGAGDHDTSARGADDAEQGSGDFVADEADGTRDSDNRDTDNRDTDNRDSATHDSGKRGRARRRGRRGNGGAGGSTGGRNEDGRAPATAPDATSPDAPAAPATIEAAPDAAAPDEPAAVAPAAPPEAVSEATEAAPDSAADAADAKAAPKRRSRRRKSDEGSAAPASETAPASEADSADDAVKSAPKGATPAKPRRSAAAAGDKSKRATRRGRTAKPAAAVDGEAPTTDTAPADHSKAAANEAASNEPAPPAPAAPASEPAAPKPAAAAAPAEAAVDPASPGEAPRRGWWQRTFGA